jgi:hypothetical protein
VWPFALARTLRTAGPDRAPLGRNETAGVSAIMSPKSSAEEADIKITHG